MTLKNKSKVNTCEKKIDFTRKETLHLMLTIYSALGFKETSISLQKRLVGKNLIDYRYLLKLNKYSPFFQVDEMNSTTQYFNRLMVNLIPFCFVC